MAAKARAENEALAARIAALNPHVEVVPHALRLDAALAVGADHVIDVEATDPVARVAEITGGAMADVVIDAASGNPVTVRRIHVRLNLEDEAAEIW